MSLSHEVIEITCKALTTGLGHLKKKERKKERKKSSNVSCSKHGSDKAKIQARAWCGVLGQAIKQTRGLLMLKAPLLGAPPFP